MICKDCGKEHEKPVESCSECGCHNLRKPLQSQLKYAKNMFDGYVNKSNQMLIDVLKEIEDDSST